jgi:uncharacterized protein
MKNVINWFEIYTSDINRAKKFYSTVFDCGFKENTVDNERHSQMKYAIFTGNNNKQEMGGALVEMAEAKPGIGGTLVYFTTADINTEIGRVEDAGGKIIRPKLHVGDFGFIALIADTEGNMIGLHSAK